MRRYRWLGSAVLLTGVLSSCHGPATVPSARARSTTVPTNATTSVPTPTTTPTTRTIPPFVPSEVAHLGETLSFTATQHLTPGLETAAVRITLDNVIDPAPGDLDSDVPQVDNRNVELRVTVDNVGDVTVPATGQGDEDVLSIEWALDVDSANGDGVPTYQFEGLPSATCTGAPTNFPQPGIAPGQSVTGCVQFFDLENVTSVHNATALLLFVGAGSGAAPGEWLIP
jgi:hypothetical protein